MTIRAKVVLAPLLLVSLVPVAATGQDPDGVLDTLRKLIGGVRVLRVTAAGSEYIQASESSSRQHVRLQGFTQETDLTKERVSERYVLVDTRATGAEPVDVVRVTSGDSPWLEQYRLWTTPYGFLEGLASRPHRVTTETLFGRTYRVVTLTPAAGRDVRGYINDSNVLERTRTEFDRPGGARVQFEAIYLDWTDYDGVSYPSVIIEKENNDLARILVVDGVTRAIGAPQSP